MPLLCVRPSVQRCHRHVKIVNIVFADSSQVCSGIVILGPGTVTGFRTKKAGQQTSFSHKKAGQQTSTSHPCTTD